MIVRQKRRQNGTHLFVSCAPISGRPYLQPTPTVVLESNATTISIQGKGFCFTNCSLNTVSFSQSVGPSLHCARIKSCSYSNITCELGGVGVIGTLLASVSVSQFSCPVVGDSNLELVADVMPSEFPLPPKNYLTRFLSLISYWFVSLSSNSAFDHQKRIFACTKRLAHAHPWQIPNFGTFILRGLSELWCLLSCQYFGRKHDCL